MSRRRPGKSKTGFTLVELMIVTAILAILATVAIVSYRGYLTRTRVSEAYGMLGMIRMRQESYRSEFSQYCDVSSATQNGESGTEVAAGLWPTSDPTRDPADWGTPPAAWTQLGVRPSNRVYYRYGTVAGNPGTSVGIGGGLGYSGADAWWVAHAYGDLDGDGQRSTFEAFSQTSSIWVHPAEGE